MLRVFPQPLEGMNGNFSQEAVKETGAGYIEVFTKHRKKNLAAVEEEGGNFTFLPG
jgi:hypothetical protein